MSATSPDCLVTSMPQAGHGEVPLSYIADTGQPGDIDTDFSLSGPRERAAKLAPPEHRTPSLLHVGCGIQAREKLPTLFHTGWKECRLDIDPDVRPDYVASITDMRVISGQTFDAVYSSHNVEHLYPHEVPLALREMLRVLKSTGFALIRLPDLREVARHIADGKLETPLYISPMGPIAPIDILYGHRASLASGNAFMAHRTGFTSDTLGAALIEAGFATAMVQSTASNFSLTAIAFRSEPSEARMTTARVWMLPAPDQSAVLYTRTR
jgi:SAM-dependent methyltransferase